MARNIISVLPDKSTIENILRGILGNRVSMEFDVDTTNIISPSTYTTKLKLGDQNAWIKFSLATSPNEGAIYQRHFSNYSTVSLAKVLINIKANDYVNMLVLEDLNGYSLREHPEGISYLSDASQVLAMIQHQLNREYNQLAIQENINNIRDYLYFGLNPKAIHKLKEALDMVQDVSFIFLHGDSIPNNWIKSNDEKRGVIPIDFQEVKFGFCLQDLYQLVHPSYWGTAEKAGILIKEAICNYSQVMQRLGYKTPWLNNEYKYFNAISVIHAASMMNWYYEQAKKDYLVSKTEPNNIHPIFKSNPTDILAQKNEYVIKSEFPRIL
ncbi:hypothetical protein COD81_28160 [Bacillus cereus]|uniref:hypothetical protein n=1 Tax=Bacillus cereus TaxID=1396 RepID=UPI000BF7A918|nr:hypothetical protein [Bacillus cereus]PFL72616.1 hypothetical protein COJ32_29920 [Bacillus cereus]PGV02895.1 hypothetical protein COD81_28160 [Bacillus cereus]